MADKVGGFLEVGCNDDDEIVVNHPDLKPDKDGVGHIVFSPHQARNLAQLLLDHAASAEREIHRKKEEERIKNLPPLSGLNQFTLGRNRRGTGRMNSLTTSLLFLMLGAGMLRD